jgi:hypothetical protein
VENENQLARAVDLRVQRSPRGWGRCVLDGQGGRRPARALGMTAGIEATMVTRLSPLVTRAALLIWFIGTRGRVWVGGGDRRLTLLLWLDEPSRVGRGCGQVDLGDRDQREVQVAQLLQQAMQRGLVDHRSTNDGYAVALVV